MSAPAVQQCTVQSAAFPRLIYDQAPTIDPARGELEQIWRVIRNALALIRQCLRIAASVLWQRFRAWFEDRVLHSLTSAWVTCGIGWGGCIGLIILNLTR